MADPIVVVIGAGPAGTRAAETIAHAGLRPIVLDEAERPGGQIYRQPPWGAAGAERQLYGPEAAKASAIHRVLDALGGRVDYRPRTLVWNLFQGGLDLLGPAGYAQQRFDRLILATGAMDRVLPFPGWTLPGVFTLGGAQIALKSQSVSIGRRVALVGAGPLLPLVAYQYRKAGARLVAVLDATPFSTKAMQVPGLMAEPRTLAKGLATMACNHLGSVTVRYDVHAIRAEGATQVEAVSYRDVGGREHRVACDAVGASFGLRSETQLADLAGCAFVFDRVERQWRPQRTNGGRSTVPSVYLAGDGAGIGGADVAELQGRRAAMSMLDDLGRAVDRAQAERLDQALARQARFRRALEAAYPFPAHLLDEIGDQEMICRCEGITAGALRQAARQNGATEINRLKALTRIGMGRCQGRVCALAAAELLARARGVDIESVGRLRGQPPVKPIPVLASEP